MEIVEKGTCQDKNLKYHMEESGTDNARSLGNFRLNFFD